MRTVVIHRNAKITEARILFVCVWQIGCYVNNVMNAQAEEMCQKREKKMLTSQEDLSFLQFRHFPDISGVVSAQESSVLDVVRVQCAMN